MDKYELVVVVDAGLTQDEKESIVKAAGDIIAKSEGKVINSQVWLDKNKLSFRIKNKTEGTFYLLNFESNKSAVAKVNQLLKLNEKILRTLIVKVD